MKKFTMLALALVLTAGLLTGCGCTNQNTGSTSTPTTLPTMETTRPTIAPATRPATETTMPTTTPDTETGETATAATGTGAAEETANTGAARRIR